MKRREFLCTMVAVAALSVTGTALLPERQADPAAGSRDRQGADDEAAPVHETARSAFSAARSPRCG